MQLGIFLAGFFSTVALTALWLDWLAGVIPLRIVALAGLSTAIFVVYGIQRREKKAPRSFLIISTAYFCLVSIYLLIPWFNTRLPLSRNWDGANHLVLIQTIFKFFNHHEFFHEKFHLCFGKTSDIWSYPWGYHAGVAAIGRLAGIVPTVLIHPLGVAAVASALIVLPSRLLNGIRPWVAYASITAYLLIFQNGLISIFYLNHWSQTVGLLLAACLMATMTMPKTPFAVLCLLWGGIFFVYPLYGICSVVGFLIFAFLRKPAPLRAMFGPIGIGFLLTAPVLVPTFKQNLARTFKPGPQLWGAGAWLTDWVLIILVIAALWFLVDKLDKPPFDIFLIPIGIIGCLLPLMLIGASQYWIWKVLFLGVFLLTPAMAVGIDTKILRPLTSGPLRQSAPAAGMIGILAVLALEGPVRYSWQLQPALSRDDVVLQTYLDEQYPGRRVFYVTTPLKIPWLESFRIRTKLLVSDEVVSVIRDWDPTYDPTHLIPLFYEIGRRGDLLTVEKRNIEIVDRRFQLRKRIGDWEIFELRKDLNRRDR